MNKRVFICVLVLLACVLVTCGIYFITRDAQQKEENETSTFISTRASRHINVLPELSVCGPQSFGNRIYGGNETDIDEYPWMALLEYKKGDIKGFRCGGFLITKRYVMTAAHCIPSQSEEIDKLGNLQSVRLGEHDITKEIDCAADDCAPPPEDIPIEKVIIHPDYIKNNVNQYNDIALIRLSRDVTFSDFIAPVCLNSTLKVTGNGTVIGWGRTENDNQSSNVKRDVVVPYFDHRGCGLIYRKYGHRLKESQICFGGKPGQDSCLGDSGGPLVMNYPTEHGVRWFVAGIVSTGSVLCGEPTIPAIYTNVPHYYNWIVQNLYA